MRAMGLRELRKHLIDVFLGKPFLVGLGVAAAGVAGLMIQLGAYVAGMLVVLGGAVLGVAAEMASTRRSGKALRETRRESSTRLPIPRQLPTVNQNFVGRSAELDRLNSLMIPRTGIQAVVISAVAGMAGVGKTSMAVQWGHSNIESFPDGQLYINLRGFAADEPPLSSEEALRGLIDALEVEPARIPQDVEGMGKLFRSLLWDKRMLLLLDNASDEKQVRPLLPSSPGCVVVITSRNRLSGLLVEGVKAVSLDVLSMEESVELLKRLTGRAGTNEDGSPLREIAGICGNLPLALTIVAARTIDSPNVTLSEVAARIRRVGQQNQQFPADDPLKEVRLVFSWSYNALADDEAAAFRLLSLHPPFHFPMHAAAAIVGEGFNTTERLLRELTRFHMISNDEDGNYYFHDLLREYSASEAATRGRRSTQLAAVRRMVHYYLGSAYSASRAINPLRPSVPLVSLSRRVLSRDFEDEALALNWMDQSYRVVIAIIEIARGNGFHSEAWQIAWTMTDFLDRRALWRQLLRTQQMGIESASRVGSALAQGLCNRWLGKAQLQLSLFADARDSFERASPFFREIGDFEGQALTQHNLALLEERLGNYSDALTFAETALTLYRQDNNPSATARGLNAVGWYNTLLGRHADAVPVCEEALAVQKELNDRQGMADTLDSLGHANLNLESYLESVTWYEEAIHLYHEIGNLPAEAASLAFLGEAHLALRDRRSAKHAWKRSLSLLQEIGQEDNSDLVGRIERVKNVRFPPFRSLRILRRSTRKSSDVI
ncbi:ATP-binding protein [Actinoplanes xinjiangensis]|uniref:ATP-binding protein n=1 Tax=Actinoplanes xinjiangensis TaxID=512350 RepID=UPI003428ED88